MNVFTGLAVGDVAIAMSEAENIQARYQMKLVANIRAHQYFKRQQPMNKVLIEIINNEEYNILTRIRNVFRRNYNTSTVDVMRKAKLCRWLTIRDQFIGTNISQQYASQGGALFEQVKRLDKKIEVISTELQQIHAKFNRFKENECASNSVTQKQLTKIIELLDR